MVPVEIKLSPDRPVLACTGETTTVLVKIEVRGRPRVAVERPPVNVCLVIDKSGSMSGERIEQARQGALEALRRLGPEDTFSLVVFDSRVEALIPARRLESAHEAEEAIRSLRAGGTTNLHGGLVEGGKQLRRGHRPGQISRLVLLSDGHANVGPRDPRELADLGRQLAAEGITVSTVGLGLDYNEDLMTALSQASEGNTYFVETPRDLPRIFNRELGEVLEIVAAGVRLEITPLPGTTIHRVLGREATVMEGAHHIDLREVAAEQAKYVVLEVEIPAGTEGERRALLTAGVRYQVPGDNRDRQLPEEQTAVRFSDDSEKLARVDHAVETAHARLLLAHAREAAIERADDFDPEGVVFMLSAPIANLLERAESSGNAEVRALAEEAFDLSEAIGTNGMDNAQRKRLRAEAYQERTNQNER